MECLRRRWWTAAGSRWLIVVSPPPAPLMTRFGWGCGYTTTAAVVAHSLACGTRRGGGGLFVSRVFCCRSSGCIAAYDVTSCSEANRQARIRNDVVPAKFRRAQQRFGIPGSRISSSLWTNADWKKVVWSDCVSQLRRPATMMHYGKIVSRRKIEGYLFLVFPFLWMLLDKHILTNQVQPFIQTVFPEGCDLFPDIPPRAGRYGLKMKPLIYFHTESDFSRVFFSLCFLKKKLQLTSNRQYKSYMVEMI